MLPLTRTPKLSLSMPQTLCITPTEQPHTQAKGTTYLRFRIRSKPLKSIRHSSRPTLVLGKSVHCTNSLDNEWPSFLLSHAQYTLGDYAAAASAFRRGLELDPTNANLKSGLTNAEERVEEGVPSLVPDESVAASPNAGGAGAGLGGLGGMADMLRGMGGGAGGGGGMPDIASMMQNPALMQMAQNMMANGGLESLCANVSFILLSMNLTCMLSECPTQQSQTWFVLTQMPLDTI